jgi:hypothetical protein
VVDGLARRDSDDVSRVTTSTVDFTCSDLGFIWGCHLPGIMFDLENFETRARFGNRKQLFVVFPVVGLRRLTEFPTRKPCGWNPSMGSFGRPAARAEHKVRQYRTNS